MSFNYYKQSMVKLLADSFNRHTISAALNKLDQRKGDLPTNVRVVPPGEAVGLHQGRLIDTSKGITAATAAAMTGFTLTPNRIILCPIEADPDELIRLAQAYPDTEFVVSRGQIIPGALASDLGKGTLQKR